MKNKLFLATIAAAVAIPAMVAPIQADAVVQKPFKDIAKSSPYYDIIHDMRDKGIISGYENGTFRANESISRKHAAALIGRAKELKSTVPFVQFKDVSKSNPYFNDIKKLQQAGIFKADAKGNFNPNQPISRAEMAKILTVSFDLKAKDAKDFPDVPENHPSYNDVKALYSNGVTTGDDGLFKPDASLTRAHYAVFMHRAMIMEKSGNDVDSMTEEELNLLSNDQIIKFLYMYNYEHGEDVPLPKGQKDRVAFSKLKEKEFNTYFVKNGLDRKSSTPLISTFSLDKHLKNMAQITNRSLSEMINMHNHVVTTGEMITNNDNDTVNFAMYFNYEENRFYFAFQI